MKKISFLIIIALLSGCASKPPLSISKIPSSHLTVAQVQSNPVLFIGSEVRWGGVITQVENKATQTWIEVVSRALDRDGKPRGQDSSGGRFIASLAGFADPAVYQTGHLLTVVGTIEQQVTRPIGEYQYTFPVVAVTGSYMWMIEPEFLFLDYPPSGRHYDSRHDHRYDPWPYYYYPYPFRPIRPIHPRHR